MSPAWNSATITPLLLSAEDAAHFLRISERLFHELRHGPNFPKPVALSARCVRWKRDELAAYVAALPTVGDCPEPTALQNSRKKSGRFRVNRAQV